MPIFDGSRYEGALVLRVPDADGEVKPAVYAMVAPLTSGIAYRTYVVADGDRLDALAHSLYGDSKLWWIIANANPEFLFPEDIPAGSIIRLPVL